MSVRFDEYTDVLCSATGISSAQFYVNVDDVVDNTVRVELLAYECRATRAP